MARNEFAGPCYRCGLNVPAGTGHFERVPFKERRAIGAKWRVRHHDYEHHDTLTCAKAKLKQPPATT